MSKKQHKTKQKTHPKQKPLLHSKHPPASKPRTGFFSGIGAFLSNKNVHFAFGFLIMAFTVYISIAFLSFFFTGAADQDIVANKGFRETVSQKGLQNWAGVLGAYLSDVIIDRWFGIPSAFLLFLLGSVGFKMVRPDMVNLLRRFFICSLATIWTSVCLAFICSPLKNIYFKVGGEHGFAITEFLSNNIGNIGVIILLIAGLFILLFCMNSRIATWMQQRVGGGLSNDEDEDEPDEPEPEESEMEDCDPETPDIEEEEEEEEEPVEVRRSNPPTVAPPTAAPNDGFTVTVAKGDDEDEFDPSKLGVYDPRLDLSSFKFPDVTLLKKYEIPDSQVDMDEQNENKNRIKRTLESFKIPIVSIKATVGPAITLYEVVQEAGVRISKIKALEDDIAMRLYANAARIIAPMPGKGTVGIEIPNKNPQIVSMESVITSRKFAESRFELPIALGRTITNEVFMFDLVKMPHLLIAGATGQGKSVGLNAIITSLLYKKHPSELKFVLIDPKMVEFSMYEALQRHYLAKLPDMEKAIITDFTKVLDTLKSLCVEMENRYELLTAAHVKNIAEYNEKFINRRLNPENGHKYLPYIVVVIDEFGDLIMQAKKDIELPIARIAQKARAVGMHMIIATQRPSVGIITGVIKANFPARIAFKVVQRTDSGTILDTTGANKLVGRGDLLFSQGSELTRVQCALINTDEIEGIVKCIGEQPGYPGAYPLPEPVIEGQDTSMGAVDLSDRDPLFLDAARLVVVSQQGSASNLQRKFSIGYNRAGKLMDQLEAAGIVSENDGSKGRQVLIPDEYSLEKLLSHMNLN